MNSNKITAIRITNLFEQDDAPVHALIDYEILKIHRPEIRDDIRSKKDFFERIQIRGRVRILRVIEDGLFVAVHFRVEELAYTTDNLFVFRFNSSGSVTELWTNSQEEVSAGTNGSALTRAPGELIDTATTQDLRLSEGNYTLTATRFVHNGTELATFRLHRQMEGRVVEHWDVSEPVPGPDQWKNDWGKF